MGLLDDARGINQGLDSTAAAQAVEDARASEERARLWDEACAPIPELARDFASVARRTNAGKAALEKEAVGISRRPGKRMWPVQWKFGEWSNGDSYQSFRTVIFVYENGTWGFGFERNTSSRLWLRREFFVPDSLGPTGRSEEYKYDLRPEVLQRAFAEALAPLIRP